MAHWLLTISYSLALSAWFVYLLADRVLKKKISCKRNQINLLPHMHKLWNIKTIIKILKQYRWISIPSPSLRLMDTLSDFRIVVYLSPIFKVTQNGNIFSAKLSIKILLKGESQKKVSPFLSLRSGITGKWIATLTVCLYKSNSSWNRDTCASLLKPLPTNTYEKEQV